MSPLRVDDHVVFRSRACVVRGFTPMGVEPTLVFLEDAASKELVRAPLADFASRDSDRGGFAVGEDEVSDDGERLSRLVAEDTVPAVGERL